MIITRFAPAPTGFLHLGHIVNAIYVWGVARASGGRVLLRIEDHDRRRSRPEFERAILDDLDWLGFAPDDPSTAAFRDGSCAGRQSDRHALYQAALQRLRERDLVYACECSRRNISGPGGAAGEESRYPGTCAERGLPDRDGLSLRVKLAPSLERFLDGRHGPQQQTPSDQCGDLMIRDREGNWTYQFAATVDDLEQRVSLVVRGDDLLSSTGRQIQLARLLGRDQPPRFLHHPLVMKSPDQKLSKSDRDTGVRDLRASGWHPEDVIGEAAAVAGLIDRRRNIRASEVSSLFDERFTSSLRGRG